MFYIRHFYRLVKFSQCILELSELSALSLSLFKSLFKEPSKNPGPISNEIVMSTLSSCWHSYCFYMFTNKITHFKCIIEKALHHRRKASCYLVWGLSLMGFLLCSLRSDWASLNYWFYQNPGQRENDQNLNSSKTCSLHKC